MEYMARNEHLFVHLIICSFINAKATPNEIIFAWFWTKIGGFSAFCPKKACLSIQLKAKNVKKRITC